MKSSKIHLKFYTSNVKLALFCNYSRKLMKSIIILYAVFLNSFSILVFYN